MNLLLSIVTAIAKYMREEAQGLNMMPQQGICEVKPHVSKQLKITEVLGLVLPSV